MKINDELLNNKRNTFGTYDAALATLLFIILNFAFMEGFRFLARQTYVSMLGLIIAQFLVEALFGVASLLVAKFCRVNIIKAAGLNKKVNLKIVVYCVLIALVSLLFFVRLTAVFMQILSVVGYSTSSSGMDVGTFPKYLGYVIAACVTPAICEELLFRGTILSGVKKCGKWFAILFSALIFMLMHGSPDQTIHQFIIGVLVGYIFFETGNLWLGVIIHFTNNFIAITEEYLISILNLAEQTAEQTEEVIEVTQIEMMQILFYQLVIALIMAFVGYVIIKSLVKGLIYENKKLNPDGENNKSSVESGSVVIDGEEVLTEIELSSKDELLSKTAKKEETKEVMSMKTKVLFGISIGWLIIDWILALIAGF